MTSPSTLEHIGNLESQLAKLNRELAFHNRYFPRDHAMERQIKIELYEARGDLERTLRETASTVDA